jgi:predicted ester cyclase
VINTYRGAFPDSNITIHEQIADGDTVVTRWTATGTHTGTLFGIAPTGRRVTCTGMVISHFKNGKVIEEFESYDSLGLMRQIGVLPAALGKAA